MKHTPGPWKLYARGDCSDFDGDSAVITGAGDSVRIAVVHHAGTEEDQANANLIAAAPTMLAALRAVLSSATPKAHEHPAMHLAWEVAKEAIAKAEGLA